jgi:hypothetical protein
LDFFLIADARQNGPRGSISMAQPSTTAAISVNIQLLVKIHSYPFDILVKE